MFSEAARAALLLIAIMLLVGGIAEAAEGATDTIKIRGTILALCGAGALVLLLR